jgi:uncharacterized protein YbcI
MPTLLMGNQLRVAESKEANLLILSRLRGSLELAEVFLETQRQRNSIEKVRSKKWEQIKEKNGEIDSGVHE